MRGFAIGLTAALVCAAAATAVGQKLESPGMIESLGDRVYQKQSVDRRGLR